MMLCGAFPMVYLIKRYLSKPLAKIGGLAHLSSDATTGLLAAAANVLAALAMVKDLKARDKVIVISFAVCCAFLFDDHLSFTANFQPSLIAAVMGGKIVGGICAIVFAFLLAVKEGRAAGGGGSRRRAACVRFPIRAAWRWNTTRTCRIPKGRAAARYSSRSLPRR